MITEYKLFENNKLNNPWSEYYIEKYSILKRIYKKLEIVKFEGEDWIILHHFGSKEAYNPIINCRKYLKDRLNEIDFNYLKKELNRISNFSKIDFSLITKFLTYPKFDLDLYHLNLLSKILGFQYYEDYCKHLNDKYSNDLVGELNPDFYGTGYLTKEDRKQLPFNVIMFYVDLKDKEKFFSNKAYYKIRYPLNKIYPTFANPYNFNFYNLSDLIKNIKNNNFDGNILKWKKEAYRCDFWKKIPITYIKNGKIKHTKYLIDFKI